MKYLEFICPEGLEEEYLNIWDLEPGTVLSLLLGVARLNFNLSFMILIEEFYSLNYYEYTLNENILAKPSRVETNQFDQIYTIPAERSFKWINALQEF